MDHLVLNTSAVLVYHLSAWNLCTVYGKFDHETNKSKLNKCHQKEIQVLEKRLFLINIESPEFFLTFEIKKFIKS